MFVNCEHFRQISQNCDYFAIFKNPRNSSEIRTLAQQMTPGNLILVQIYMEATKMPFSYLFINLTQECDPRVKYLSNLFNEFVNVYQVDGNNFTTVKAKNNAGRIVTVQDLKSFQPSTVQNIVFQPMMGSPGEPMKYNVDNKTLVKTEKDTVGIQ